MNIVGVIIAVAAILFGCGTESNPVFGPDSYAAEMDVAQKGLSALVFPFRMLDGKGTDFFGSDTVFVFEPTSGRLLSATLSQKDLATGVFWAGITLFAGDFNRDLRVSMDDYFLFADNFGSMADVLDLSLRPLDINRDGKVNLPDFLIFADNFGKTISAAKPVVSQAEMSRLAEYTGELGMMADVIIAMAEEPLAPPAKLAGGAMPLRLVISASPRRTEVDTIVFRDWIAISQYYRTAGMATTETVDLFTTSVTGPTVSVAVQSVSVGGYLYRQGDNHTIFLPCGVVPVALTATGASTVTWSRIYLSGLETVEEVLLWGFAGNIDPFAGVSGGQVVLKVAVEGAGGRDYLRVNLARAPSL